MIFTKSLINPFVHLSAIPTQRIYKTLNDIGLEVDSFHSLRTPDKVVVGKVLECEKHPDADKLNVCQVDIGEEQRQIVCGAKNVAAGQWVAVALEGAKISDTLTIKKAKLRGIESQGMICSSSELGFPKLNEGIMILDSSIGELKLGKPLHEYPLFNDDIFEIDITPNRGDCLSLYGVARELAAAYDLDFNEYPKEQEEDNVLGIGRLLQVSHEGKLDSSLLYKTVQLNELKLPLSVALTLAYNDLLGESVLQNFIQYATLVSGVSIKAYRHDACLPASTSDEKPLKASIMIKKDENGLESVYAGEKKLSTIGVSQNRETMPLDAPEVVILEASYTPPAIISEGVARSKVEKETRFFYRASRGSNPHLPSGITLLCSALHKMGGALIYSGTHEITQNYKPATITVDLHSLSAFIGQEVPKTKVVSLLKSLKFEVDLASDDSFLAIRPPLFRHDIHNKQDIAEEIVRLLGIDTILAKPLYFAEKRRTDEEYTLYKHHRSLAKRAMVAGFNETIHFVFNQKSRLKEWSYTTIDESVDLLNPITSELDTLRPTLLLSLLDSVVRNKNLGYSQIALFEMGSTYTAARQERFSLAFVASGLKKEAIYPYPKGEKWSLFGFAEEIASVIGEFSLEQRAPQSEKLFHPAQCAYIIQKGERIGTIAKLHPLAQEAFDLEETFVAEIDLEALKPSLIQAQSFSKFPKLQRDLTVLISKNHPFSALRQEIKKLGIIEIKELFPLDIYTDEKIDEEQISLTIRLLIQSDSKTLEEEEIVSITQKVLDLLTHRFGAKLR